MNNELREAIREHPERPLEFEDAETRTAYVLLTRDQFRRLVYDDSELTPEEMAAAAASILTGDVDSDFDSP
ncbi:MAG: hypothetical protein WD069_05290 [Planctomycetales bacterium]